MQPYPVERGRLSFLHMLRETLLEKLRRSRSFGDLASLRPRPKSSLEVYVSVRLGPYPPNLAVCVCVSPTSLTWWRLLCWCGNIWIGPAPHCRAAEGNICLVANFNCISFFALKFVLTASLHYLNYSLWDQSCRSVWKVKVQNPANLSNICMFSGRFEFLSFKSLQSWWGIEQIAILFIVVSIKNDFWLKCH